MKKVLGVMCLLLSASVCAKPLDCPGEEVEDGATLQATTHAGDPKEKMDLCFVDSIVMMEAANNHYLLQKTDGLDKDDKLVNGVRIKLLDANFKGETEVVLKKGNGELITLNVVSGSDTSLDSVDDLGQSQELKDLLGSK